MDPPVQGKKKGTFSSNGGGCILHILTLCISVSIVGLKLIAAASWLTLIFLLVPLKIMGRKDSFVSSRHIFIYYDICIHTVWSVNDGLSGNLLETSGNQPRKFPAGFRIFIGKVVFFKFFLLIKKSGNLPETDLAAFRRFPGVSGWSIIDGPHGSCLFETFVNVHIQNMYVVTKWTLINFLRD